MTTTQTPRPHRSDFLADEDYGLGDLDLVEARREFRAQVAESNRPENRRQARREQTVTR